MSVRGRNKRRVEVIISELLYDRFRRAVNRQGYGSMAEVLRHLIIEFCNRHKEE